MWNCALDILSREVDNSLVGFSLLDFTQLYVSLKKVKTFFMRLKIYPDNPQEKFIQQTVSALEKGEVVVLPTDTIYCLAADINKSKALENMAKIKGVSLKEADFSFLFSDLSHLSDYTLQFDTHVYKVLKRGIPGPFTFVLRANKKVPKIFGRRKTTIGIRVPDNPIVKTIIERLGHPLATTSIKSDDSVVEYITDPELIDEVYGPKVAHVVDGGFGGNEGSTVVDLTDGVLEIIREGAGDISKLS